MSINKTAVFISSRFSEFHDFRKALAGKINHFPYLALHAVELDDNGVETAPPSTACVNWIKRSELLILLLGNTYGPLVKGEDLSCTHLEYRAALEESSGTRVLPFFIGSDVGTETKIVSTADPRLAAFQREVMDNHRVGIFDRPQSEEAWQELLEIIFGWTTKALWEVSFGDLSQQSDLDDAEIGEIAGVSDTALQRLSASRAEKSSEMALLLQPPSLDSDMEAIRQPKAVEAAEQLREARLALQIHEGGIAERHLRSAVSIRPLDPVGNEWLARLLLSKGRKKSSLEAITIADRAARIYRKSDQALRASAASILAARAAGEFDREQGLSYAAVAVQDAGWFSQAHLEFARQLAQANQIRNAMAELDSAFKCHPVSLDNIVDDPAFAIVRPRIQSYVIDWRKKVLGVNEGIATAERDISAILGIGTSDRSRLFSGQLSTLVYAGRNVLTKLFRKIQNQAARYVESDHQNSPSPSSAIYVWNAAWIALGANRPIEVVKIHVREGAVVEAGDSLLTYTMPGWGRELLIKAPIRILVEKIATPKQLLRGTDVAVSWSPAPHNSSRHELEQRLAQLQEGLQQLQLAKAQTESGQRSTSIARLAYMALAILLGLGAWLSNTGMLVRLVIGAGSILCFYAGLVRWNKLDLLKKHLAQQNANVDIQSSRISKVESTVSTIERIRKENVVQLTEMIDAYDRALSTLTVSMPFPGLLAAKTGDWVVVEKGSLDRYAESVGLTVTFKDDTDLEAVPVRALFRVVALDNRKMVLSRAAAYIPAQAY